MKSTKSKDIMLQKIMELFAKAAEIEIEAHKLGAEYTAQHCPYKKGQKIIVDLHGRKIWAVIHSVSFDQHGTLTGKARLVAIPYTKNWVHEIENRSYIWIGTPSSDAKIVAMQEG